MPLGKLNDSNPTRHGLAPALVPGTYTADPRGPRPAREALASFLTELHRGAEGAGTAPAADPDRLYLLSSTSQAYSWLMKLLCDAGDAVLAPKPGYPLIESIARLECVDTIEYQLRFDGSWYIDVAELRALLDGPQGARIRALVLINPNNPTGSYVKAGEREQLAGEAGALTFALDGFSKMLAAPHAKVGWIQVSGPETDVREAMRRLDVIADDYLPMSDIIASRIPDLLEAAKVQTDLVRGRVQGNLRALHRMLESDPLGVVSVLRAEGGWNVLLRVPGVIDENELVLHMIDAHGVSGQPGYFFDMASNGYLAISLLPEPDEFAHNVRVVLDSVAELLG